VLSALSRVVGQAEEKNHEFKSWSSRKLASPTRRVQNLHMRCLQAICISCMLFTCTAFRPFAYAGLGRHTTLSLVKKLNNRILCATPGKAADDHVSNRLTAASEATTKTLPPSRRGSLHFVNLSNGVEALPLLQGQPFAFVRIQSSHCEANNFDGILGALDSTFLMYLAMGHDCYM